MTKTKPKFRVGQVVAEIGHGCHYMKIVEISKHFARVLGYSGEYAMRLVKLRSLTDAERVPAPRRAK